MTYESRPRRRGRPQGGGNTPEQARRILLEVAERQLVEDRRGATMADIAAGAGMTRAVVYRHFASRDELLYQVVERAMRRHHTRIRSLVDQYDDAVDKVTEALVYVVTEIATDPIVAILLERADARAQIQAMASDPELQETLANMYSGVIGQDRNRLRPGVSPADATRYMLGVTVMLLFGGIPGSDDPDTVRRYARTFVLPALIVDPPAADAVFQIGRK